MRGVLCIMEEVRVRPPRELIMFTGARCPVSHGAWADKNIAHVAATRCVAPAESGTCIMPLRTVRKYFRQVLKAARRQFWQDNHFPANKWEEYAVQNVPIYRTTAPVIAKFLLILAAHDSEAG